MQLEADKRLHFHPMRWNRQVVKSFCYMNVKFYKYFYFAPKNKTKQNKQKKKKKKKILKLFYAEFLPLSICIYSVYFLPKLTWFKLYIQLKTYFLELVSVTRALKASRYPASTVARCSARMRYCTTWHLSSCLADFANSRFSAYQIHWRCFAICSWHIWRLSFAPCLASVHLPGCEDPILCYHTPLKGLTRVKYV